MDDTKQYALRDERDEKRRHPEQAVEQPLSLRGDESPDQLISGSVVMDAQPETD